MSQISTRSRGVTRKPSAQTSSVLRLRKKVAPKLVSTRPKKGQPSPQKKSSVDQSSLNQNEDTRQQTTGTEIVNTPNSLETIDSIDDMPLPTLPNERIGSITDSIDIHTGTAPSICSNVDDFFADQTASVTTTNTVEVVESDNAIGSELLNLQASNTTMVSSILDTTITHVQSEGEVCSSTCNDVNRTSNLTAQAVGIGGGTVSGVLSTAAGAGSVVGEERNREQSVTDKTQSKQTRKRPLPDPSTTQAESGDKSSPPRPAAKKKRNTGPSNKERKAPDRTTMTMQELIYYNPSANPMLAAKEERERRRQSSSLPPSPEKETPQDLPQSESITDDASVADSETVGGGQEGEEEDDRIVPQLRIGADGNIIIDEASMLMKTTQSNSFHDSEAIVENSGQVTSDSFRKGYKITRWTKEETNKFFKALTHVGTDFSMMTILVPNRSRKELKNKFKREEKKSPQLIAQALKNQIKVVQKVSSKS